MEMLNIRYIKMFFDLQDPTQHKKVRHGNIRELSRRRAETMAGALRARFIRRRTAPRPASNRREDRQDAPLGRVREEGQQVGHRQLLGVLRQLPA